MSEYSRLFRAARALLGATQQELAEISGVSKATLNNIEREASNPRERTLQTIEQCLKQAFVLFDRSPEETTVSYKRLIRPSADGSVSFSNQQVLQVTLSGLWSDLTNARSLFKPNAHVFFTIDADKPEPRRSIGGLVVCNNRLILLDRIRFQLTSADAAAVFGLILQQAFHFHAAGLYYLPEPPPALDGLTDLEACARIEQAPKKRMQHVLPLLLQLGDWRQWLEPWLRIRDHPLRSLFLILENESGADAISIPENPGVEPVQPQKPVPPARRRPSAGTQERPSPEATDPVDPEDKPDGDIVRKRDDSGSDQDAAGGKSGAHDDPYAIW